MTSFKFCYGKYYRSSQLKDTVTASEPLIFSTLWSVPYLATAFLSTSERLRKKFKVYQTEYVLRKDLFFPRPRIYLIFSNNSMLCIQLQRKIQEGQTK